MSSFIYQEMRMWKKFLFDKIHEKLNDYRFKINLPNTQSVSPVIFEFNYEINLTTQLFGLKVYKNIQYVEVKNYSLADRRSSRSTTHIN